MKRDCKLGRTDLVVILILGGLLGADVPCQAQNLPQGNAGSSPGLFNPYNPLTNPFDHATANLFWGSGTFGPAYNPNAPGLYPLTPLSPPVVFQPLSSGNPFQPLSRGRGALQTLPPQNSFNPSYNPTWSLPGAGGFGPPWGVWNQPGFYGPLPFGPYSFGRPGFGAPVVGFSNWGFPGFGAWR
jgi:hypothetical protein